MMWCSNKSKMVYKRELTASRRADEQLPRFMCEMKAPRINVLAFTVGRRKTPAIRPGGAQTQEADDDAELLQ